MKVWLLVDGDGTDGAPYEVKGVFGDRQNALAAGEATVRQSPGWGPVERRIQELHDDDRFSDPHVEEWDVQ